MPKFVLNQKVPFEEGLHCEFKSISGASDPVDLIREHIDVYVVAYLNRGITGSIYWGIRDSGLAAGVSLDTGRRDRARIAIVETLGRIVPAILPTSYETILHDLLDSTGAPISDRPIVEVKVKSVSPRQVYFTGRNEAFMKTDAGRSELRGPPLLKFQNEIQNEQADQEEREPVPKPPPEGPADPTPFVNPYNIAMIATKDMFKGRESEIQKLQSAIETGTHTAIFGLQRMGKTSLVKETLRRVEENCIFAEVDLHAYGGERITYRALLHAIVTKIATEISSKRHQDVVNEINALARDYGRGDKHQMLDGFLAIVNETVKATRRKVVLFLDEFSELCQTIDKNEALLKNNLDRGMKIHPHEMIVDVSLMQWFSSLMKSDEIAGKLVFIFVARPFVEQYDGDSQLQILKLVFPITLHHLEEPEAEALMVEPLDGKIEYEAGSIDYLYYLTAGHPYLIQFFLHEIINRIRRDGRTCIEKQDIIHFEEEVVSVEGAYDGQFTILDSDYSVESVRHPGAARKGRGVLAVIAHLVDKP